MNLGSTTRPAPSGLRGGGDGQNDQFSMPIALRSNYIPVTNSPDWLLYQYHVKFEPPVDSKFQKLWLLQQHSDKLKTDQPVFDGMILYLTFKIEELDVSKENKVVWVSKNESTGGEVRLTIGLTNELLPDNPQCTTVLNVINRKALEIMKFKQFGRHFFNPDAAFKNKRYKIEIWRGIISAIRSYDCGLLLNLDMAHKVLRTDTVMDFMLEQIRLVGPERMKERCSRELLGMIVLTRYNNRTYKVEDILWDKNPLDEFKKSDGTTITYREYYFQQYNLKVTDMQQPLLLCREKRRSATGEGDSRDVFLVPQFCAMTGITDTMRADGGMMRELSKHTRVKPDDRVSDARRHLATMNGNPEVDKLFNQWNLQLETDLVNVNGRVLRAEKVEYAETSIEPRSGDWSRESKGAKVLHAVNLVNWMIIYPGPKSTNEKDVKNFFGMMKDEGSRMGIQVKEPEVRLVSSPEEYLHEIRQAPKGTQIILAVLPVLPDSQRTLYDSIKKEACLEKAIPTQCVVLNTLKHKEEFLLKSICTKIVAQMNCKMGGTLWKVTIPVKQAMVIGYDLYKDSSARGKSVGAVVSSLDANFTEYYSQTALHGNDGEMIANLTELTKNALEMYKDHNKGVYPKRIFLYRDGVGEGQIPVVENNELPQMQKALTEIYGKNCEEEGLVKFVFIIVTKRINTRFFKQKSDGSFENPPPGTVVDKIVTRNPFEWFCVPQRVNQGTVTPVNYYVIYNVDSGPKDSQYTDNQLQRLSYKLCHMYYNWQGTIRVPAPCQYAHKLAFLVSQSLHKPIHKALADKLTFL